MKKTLLSLTAIAMAMLTSCDLIGKKSGSNDAGNSEQVAPGDTTVTETPGEAEAEPAQPMPDNAKAKKIVAKFNQGPAINNADYADALEYTELYYTLIADDIKNFKSGLESGDDNLRIEAEKNMEAVEKEYPYNAQLIQILYQASELEKTEGGLVPMNDDTRARFDALTGLYK